jgi:hypothetical protein
VRSRIIRLSALAAGLVALWIAGVLGLNSSVYSAARVVVDYVDAVESGDYETALSIAGIDDAPTALPAAGSAVSGSTVTGTQTLSPDQTAVGVSYLVNREPAQSRFDLQRGPRIAGLFNSWRFVTPPTASIRVDGGGAATVLINDAEVPSGATATVLVPGVYEMSAGNQWLHSDVTRLVATTPGDEVNVALRLQPTDALVNEVTVAFDEYLQECSSRDVLQPASCPFGTTVNDRVVGTPTWTITVLPSISVTATDDLSVATVTASGGVATVTGTIQSLFDGSLRPLNRDVVFDLTAEVTGLDRDSPALRID